MNSSTVCSCCIRSAWVRNWFVRCSISFSIRVSRKDVLVVRSAWVGSGLDTGSRAAIDSK
jgi:hypothetical protein